MIRGRFISLAKDMTSNTECWTDLANEVFGLFAFGSAQLSVNLF